MSSENKRRQGPPPGRGMNPGEKPKEAGAEAQSCDARAGAGFPCRRGAEGRYAPGRGASLPEGSLPYAGPAYPRPDGSDAPLPGRSLSVRLVRGNAHPV